MLDLVHNTLLQLLWYACGKKLRELDGARARSAGMTAVYKGLAAVADGAALKQATNSSDSARFVGRASCEMLRAQADTDSSS